MFGNSLNNKLTKNCNEFYSIINYMTHVKHLKIANLVNEAADVYLVDDVSCQIWLFSFVPFSAKTGFPCGLPIPSFHLFLSLSSVFLSISISFLCFFFLFVSLSSVFSVYFYFFRLFILSISISFVCFFVFFVSFLCFLSISISFLCFFVFFYLFRLFFVFFDCKVRNAKKPKFLILTRVPKVKPTVVNINIGDNKL
jgi:hypothetical protein